MQSPTSHSSSGDRHLRKTEKYHFHVTCAPGLEDVLQEELKELGIRKLRLGRGAVRFEGTLRMALKAVMWSHIASRVLVELTRVNAQDGDELYEEVMSLPWEERFDRHSTFAIEVIGTSRSLRHTHYTSQRIKDGICDRLRKKWGMRPDVDPQRPQLLIVGKLYKNQCTLSLDLVGERLHRRGYRVDSVEAPLKENLAAGILRLSGWDGIAPLIDPMCGGGTVVIEGAMRAVRVAPGENLDPACTEWVWKGEEFESIWEELSEVAREKALENCPARIQASDINGKTLAAAQRNARKAGVFREIEWSHKDALHLKLPQGPGWIVFNPPYGERLATPESSEQLMRNFAQLWLESTDFHLAIIAPWEELPDWFERKPVKKVPLRNGKIDAFLYLFSPANASSK